MAESPGRFMRRFESFFGSTRPASACQMSTGSTRSARHFLLRSHTQGMTSRYALDACWAILRRCHLRLHNDMNPHCGKVFVEKLSAPGVKLTTQQRIGSLQNGDFQTQFMQPIGSL